MAFHRILLSSPAPAAAWIYKINYRNVYEGQLVLHLLPLLNPWLIVKMQPPWWWLDNWQKIQSLVEYSAIFIANIKIYFSKLKSMIKFIMSLLWRVYMKESKSKKYFSFSFQTKCKPIQCSNKYSTTAKIWEKLNQ